MNPTTSYLPNPAAAPARGRRGPSWLIVIAGWIVVSAALGVWLTTTPGPALRDELRRWQFWVLESHFFLLLFVSALNLPRLVRSLRLRRADFAAPAAISVLALLLAGGVSPHTSRIYYDEQIYQSIGQNLSDLRLAQMCNDGTVEYGVLQCWSGEYNKEPYGYPYILSVAYRIFGVHERVAFELNVAFMAALVWVLFFATTALFGDPRAGAFAGLAGALIPEQLRWSHSAAAEPSAALACAFAFLALAHYLRERSAGALLWTAVAAAFAVQFRPECTLLAALVGVGLIVYAREDFAASWFWAVALAGLALVTLELGHLAAVRNEPWGTTGARLSLLFLRPNLATNGWFYLADPRFSPIFTALAVCAVILGRPRRALVVCVTYFVLFWGIFLFFYAGSYNYGADDRFSLMTYPPLAMLAGVGASSLAQLVSKSRWRMPFAPSLVVASLVILQFLAYLPFVRAVGEEAWGARADVAFAKETLPVLPRNSIVLTHNPNMFHVWGRNAAQASLAANDPRYVDTTLARRYAGGVIFHWNFWCNVNDPLQQSFCTTILDKFPHTLIREYREREYRFAFYALSPAAKP
jgi:dolichyl-phosphate-mannose-protein mannosyltransferase